MIVDFKNALTNFLTNYGAYLAICIVGIIVLFLIIYFIFAKKTGQK